MINRVTWPKALLLNNLLKYFLIFLITFPIFGQISDKTYSRSNSTFKSAVEQYNKGKYKDEELILERISSVDKGYFSEGLAFFSMRVKYSLNDYFACREIGKSLLSEHPNSVYIPNILIVFGDIFIAEGSYEAAFRTYLKAFRINDDKHYQIIIVKRIFLSLQFGMSPNIPEELLSIEIDQDLIQIFNLFLFGVGEKINFSVESLFLSKIISLQVKVMVAFDSISVSNKLEVDKIANCDSRLLIDSREVDFVFKVIC